MSKIIKKVIVKLISSSRSRTNSVAYEKLRDVCPEKGSPGPFRVLYFECLRILNFLVDMGNSRVARVCVR